MAAGLRGLTLIPGIATLGGALSNVASGLLNLAGGLGGVGGLLGRAGLLGAAGAAGYAAGTWLNDRFHLSEKIVDLISDPYDPNKRPGHSPYVTHKKDQPVVVRSPVYLDGRLISENTAGHLSDAFSVPTGQLYDPTLSLPPVGLNFPR